MMQNMTEDYTSSWRSQENMDWYKKKCEVKSNSVKFFGCVYDKHRAHPDPSKVSAINEMPAP